MVHPSTLRLIDLLRELTQRRCVAWVRSDGGALFRSRNHEVEICADPCELRIRTRRGARLEISGATALSRERDEDGRGYDRVVRDLAVDAARIASGLDGAIAELTTALESGAEGEPAFAKPAGGRVVVLTGEARTREPRAESAGRGSGGGEDYSAWT